MLDFFLNGMTAYGPLMLGLAMLPGVFGVPVPAGVLLIAAGALVRQGFMDWQAAFLCAWLGALLGDVLSYTMGRWVAQWVRGRLSERYAAVWHRAEERFRNHGGWAVFTTSWLIRGLAIPTNLAAGSSRYPIQRFIAWSAAGKLVWILLHAGLGYAFARQWQFVGETMSRWGDWLGLGVAAGLGAYLLLRRLRANQGDAVCEAPTELSLVHRLVAAPQSSAQSGDR
jgi:membrane-associated protein